MEAVRAAVIDGYSQLTRGGLEVGGVLFGRRDGETLHVAASLPISCQHAYGPTFTLSDSDLVGLAKSLKSSSARPGLRGLEPVGWYHSHTRSGLEFSEHDLEVHNRCFPEAWQVALVLRPEWMKPTRAAFFVRDAQGIPRQDPEFVVQPLAGIRRIIHAAPAAPPAAPPPAPAAAKGPPPAVELPLPSFAQSPIRAAGPSRRWWVWFAVAWSVAG